MIGSRFFWIEHALNPEGVLWLERLQAKENLPPSRILVDALIAHGSMLHSMDLELAKMILTKAIAMSRAIDYLNGLGHAVTWLAIVSLGDRTVHKEFVDEGIDIFRANGDKVGLGWALCCAGWIEYRYDYAQSAAFLAESETLFRELGHLVGIQICLKLRAAIATRLGHFEEAHTALEEALSLSQDASILRRSQVLNDMGTLYYFCGEYENAKAVLLQMLSYGMQVSNTQNHGWSCAFLGWTHLKLHEVQLAQNAFQEALSLYKQSKTPHLATFTVEGVACMGLALEVPESAACLYGWTDKRREILNDPRPPIEVKAVEQDKAIILQQIGEEMYTAAYERGRGLSEDEAMTIVQEIFASVPT